MRYQTIEDQLNYRKESLSQFSQGIKRFAVGLGKKVILANNIGALFAEISAAPQAELSVAASWLGILAYTFQIYFDFSGYSDMAIGLGKMFGFDFLENFNYPYFKINNRILEKMAYLPFHMVQRLRLYTSRRKPQGKAEAVRKYNDRMVSYRLLARS